MARSVYFPLGRMAEYVPKHPERTAYRSGPSFDSQYEMREWTSREAMLATIRMQERRAPHYLDWKDWTASRWYQVGTALGSGPSGASAGAVGHGRAVSLKPLRED